MLTYAIALMLSVAPADVAMRVHAAEGHCLHLLHAVCVYVERCGPPEGSYDVCSQALLDSWGGRSTCERLESWPSERRRCAAELITGPGCGWPDEACGQ